MARVKWPDREVLVKSAEVSYLAYKKRDKLQNLKKDWMDDVGFFSDDDAVLFVEEKEPKIDLPKTNRIFIAFRGTQKFKDFIDDLNILKTLLSDCTIQEDGGTFHQGFKNRSRHGWQVIFEKLYGISKSADLENYDIILCGHSLGGAAAAVTYIRMKTKRAKVKSKKKEDESNDSVMAIEYNSTEVGEAEGMAINDMQKDILKELPNDIRCITFGSPTFGNIENKQYCIKTKFSSAIFNIIQLKDTVPKLFFKIPDSMKPSFMIKADCCIGNYGILADGGNMNEKYNYDQVNLIENKLKEKVTTNLENHKIKSYISRLTATDVEGCTELDMIERTTQDMISLKKDYRPIKLIGEGSYGWVFRGVQNDTKKDVAIKKIKFDIDAINVQIISEDNDGNEIEGSNEINSLVALNNENIVNLIDYFHFNKEKLYLVFEYCPFGSLRSFVIEHIQKPLNENELRLLLRHVLNGLVELHSMNIIHRDIKPGNILVGDSIEKPIFKIADLGSSNTYEGRTVTMTVTGTKLYMSPEVFEALAQKKKKVRLNAKTDIFSLGTVALFCLKVAEPWTENEFYSFANVDVKKMVKEILAGTGNEYGNDLEDLISEMLSYDRHERPEAKNILNFHPFVTRDILQETAKPESIIHKWTDLAHRFLTEGEIITNNDNSSENNEEDLNDDIKEYFRVPKDFLSGFEKFENSRYAHALYCYQKSLDILKDIHGEDSIHIDTCGLLNDCGLCYECMDQIDEAIIYYNKSLVMCEKRENTRKKIHLESKVFNNLGNAFYEKEDYEKAISFHKESLRNKCIFWNLMEYPDIVQELKTININVDELATHNIRFQETDTFDESEYSGIVDDKAYKDVLLLEEKFKSRSNIHSDISQSISNLGICYGKQGENDKAFECHMACLQMLYALYGEDENIDIAKSFQNLGDCYVTKKNPDIALSYYNKGLDMQIACRGEGANHPNIAMLYGCLARTESDLKKNYQGGISYYEKSLTMYSNVFSQQPGHTSIMVIRYNIGSCYKQMGQLAEAASYWDMSLNLYHSIGLKRRNSIIAKFHASLGVINIQTSPHKAMYHFKENLKIQTEIHGVDSVHKDVVDALFKFAHCLEIQGFFKEGIENYSKLLNMNIDGLMAINVLRGLGVCYSNIGEFDTAIKYYKKALNKNGFDELSFGHKAHIFGCLGISYEKKEDIANAKHYYDICLAEYKKLNPNLRYPSGIPLFDHVVSSKFYQ